MSRAAAAGLAALAGLAACDEGAPGGPPAPTFYFTDVTLAAGLDYRHGYDDLREDEYRLLAGGVAAADVDGDGWVDLYVVRGDLGPDLLFRNRGDGSFEEIGAARGLPQAPVVGSGPLLADLDGDDRLDLVVGGLEGTPARFFVQDASGLFVDTAGADALPAGRHTYGAAAGDADGDGDLDLFLSHWGTFAQPGPPEHLWRNDGGVFTDVSLAAGLGSLVPGDRDFTFTPSFTDVDLDGDLDLLVASDFGTSRAYLNDGAGAFTDVTEPVISDENGMGVALGDVDGDGDLDWFVTGVHDPDGVSEGFWGVSGNRLYENLGDGRFADVTDAAGVRAGFWGWAACFADFDNDGHLDLLQVNGYGSLESGAQTSEFTADPTRLWLGDGAGGFVERSAEVGLDDRGDGRGLVCFDHDQDGDVDAFIANHGQRPRLLRNDGPKGHALRVVLVGARGNAQAIGARVTLHAGGRAQVRELRAGSSYVSQDPAEAHFGLGTSTQIDRVEVRWPDGSTSIEEAVPAGGTLVITHPDRR